MISASAPGSFFLFGEHAVLHGKSAIVYAIDKRLTVTLKPRTDQQLIIHSHLGRYQSPIHARPFQFIHRYTLTILQDWISHLLNGIDIFITSNFSEKVGLGSSAALVIALLRALYAFANLSFNEKTLLKQAHNVIKKVQKVGSGADLTASFYGGIVHINPSQSYIEPLTCTVPPLALYYVGYKKSASEVLQKIAPHSEILCTLHHKLYCLMEECTQAALDRLHACDWNTLGKLMNYYHGLLDALGVCDIDLAKKTYLLRAQQNILGAKITGSGLGDCIVALQKSRLDTEPFKTIEVAVSPHGVQLETY